MRDNYKADPEKKASVRDTYKADPEKKKASVCDKYTTQILNLLKGGDMKRTLRRTVLLKSGDMTRTSRQQQAICADELHIYGKMFCHTEKMTMYVYGH